MDDLSENRGKRYDIFISYRRSDGEALAHVVKSELESCGCIVFLDVRDTPHGRYDNSLLALLRQTPCYVPIISPDALVNRGEDDWFWLEARTAIESGRRICPVFDNHVNIENNADAIKGAVGEIVKYEAVIFNSQHLRSCTERLTDLLGVERRKKLHGIQFILGLGRWRTSITLAISLLSLAAIVSGFLFLKHRFWTLGENRAVYAAGDTMLPAGWGSKLYSTSMVELASIDTALSTYGVIALRQLMDTSDTGIVCVVDRSNFHDHFARGNSNYVLLAQGGSTHMDWSTDEALLVAIMASFSPTGDSGGSSHAFGLSACETPDAYSNYVSYCLYNGGAGFSLAVLPAGSASGAMARNTALASVTNAMTRILELVSEPNTTQIGTLGYNGILYRHYVWPDVAGKSQRMVWVTNVAVTLSNEWPNGVYAPPINIKSER